MIMTRSLSFIVLMPLLLAACSTTTPLPKREPSFSPVAPADLRPPAQSSGGIYQSGYDNRLFEDITARRVGDILTVELEESTTSQKKAGSDDSKQDSFEMNAKGALGMFGLAEFLFGKDKMPGTNGKGSLETIKSFQGEGSAKQSNSLKSKISVTVIELLPNGNLKIRGEKRVTLNQGDEFIRLSGIVRPVDIAPNNIIQSSKIADATFMYTGDGAMNDASTHGGMSRIINSPWFPF